MRETKEERDAKMKKAYVYKLKPTREQRSAISQACGNVRFVYNHMLGRMKEEWESKGRNLLVIGRFDPSSKKCSVCGHIKDDLSLSDRQWTCPRCGTTHDRDLDAAVNILRIGLDDAWARKGGNRMKQRKKQQ